MGTFFLDILTGSRPTRVKPRGVANINVKVGFMMSLDRLQL